EPLADTFSLMNLNEHNWFCHAERSEASLVPVNEMLRCAQHDKKGSYLFDKIYQATIKIRKSITNTWQ
ncbi:MAG: hypothetical protein ACRDIV_21225, partial [Ktedonobacteraceae bacterium]